MADVYFVVDSSQTRVVLHILHLKQASVHRAIRLAYMWLWQPGFVYICPQMEVRLSLWARLIELYARTVGITKLSRKS